MAIVLFGLSHRSAPLEIRERLAFPAEGLDRALARLTGIPPVREGMILSTCNRTELLGHVGSNGLRDGAEVMKAFLAEERGFPAAELDRYCYRMIDSDAIHHLFRVAASLDSMVLGEAQILGQVKEAYQTALKARAIGSVLDHLLRRALAVAKKVRTNTAIARHPVSVSYAAVALARTIFEDLRGRQVLLIGAGKMAELAARHLVERGVQKVLITNRSYPRAVELAQAFGGEAVPFDRLLEHLEEVDIAISSTAAPEPILKFDDVHRLIRNRKNRPIFFIDIAVPRDIEPRVNSIDNVFLYDLDDLSGVVLANRAERKAAAELAETIIRREVDSFQSWARAQDLSPVIVGVRSHLDHLRAQELERYRSRLGSLSPDQRQAVEEMTGSLLNKILHHPIQALKRTAGTADGLDRVGFFKEVFGLPDDAPAGSGAADSAPEGKIADAGEEPTGGD
jgi:glutamyl-tRNA reductase